MIILRTVIIFLAVLLVSLQAEAKVTLAIKASTLIEGSRIHLGDVVDPLQASRLGTDLRQFDLGGAPLSGYTARLTRQEIERLLRAQGLLDEISLQGAEAINIERASKVFDGTQIAATATTYLQGLLGSSVNKLEIQVTEPLPDLQLPRGKLTLKPRPLSSKQALHHHVNVWVDIHIDEVFLRTVSVPVTVNAYRTALVAKQALPAGSTPSCDALQLQEVEITTFDSPPMAANCQLIDGRLKRSIAEGTALLETHFRHTCAVSQGENVSLQIRDGAVMLDALAVALNDGEVGQRIEVKPTAGTGLVVGEVIAPGVVKVVSK